MKKTNFLLLPKDLFFSQFREFDKNQNKYNYKIFGGNIRRFVSTSVQGTIEKKYLCKVIRVRKIIIDFFSIALQEEGWKLNRNHYYQEGWLSTANLRGVVGVTYTTSHCGIDGSTQLVPPSRTNYNLRGHRAEVGNLKKTS